MKYFNGTPQWRILEVTQEYFEAHAIGDMHIDGGAIIYRSESKIEGASPNIIVCDSESRPNCFKCKEQCELYRLRYR